MLIKKPIPSGYYAWSQLTKQTEKLPCTELIDKIEPRKPTLGILLEDPTALDILGLKLPIVPATVNL